MHQARGAHAASVETEAAAEPGTAPAHGRYPRDMAGGSGYAPDGGRDHRGNGQALGGTGCLGCADGSPVRCQCREARIGGAYREAACRGFWRVMEMVHLSASRRPVKVRDVRWVVAAGFLGVTLVLLAWEVAARWV